MVIVTFEVELCLQLWRCLRKYYTYLEIFIYWILEPWVRLFRYTESCIPTLWNYKFNHTFHHIIWFQKFFMTFSFRKNLAYLHQTNPRKYRHIKRRIAIPNFREGMKTSCNWTWLLIQAVSNLCWHMFCITICVFGATCLEVKHVTIIIEEYLSLVFDYILSPITLSSILSI